MANRLVRPVKTEYIPGQEFIPSSPARCYTVEKQVTYTEYTTDYGNLPPSGGSGPFSGYPSFTKLRGGTTSESKTKTVTKEVCVEAQQGQEGRPAEVITDIGEDWNAGAISLENISDNGLFGFFLNDTPQVAVGLTYEDTGPTFSDMAFGLLFRSKGSVRRIDLIVDGVVDTENVGTYAPGDRIWLGRLNGQFHAFVQSLGFVGKRAIPHTPPTHLDALLYTSNDYVDSPYKAQVLPPPGDGRVSGNLGFTARLSTTTSINGAVGYRMLATERVGGEALVSVVGAIGITGTVTTRITQLFSVSGAVGFTTRQSSFEQRTAFVVLPELAVFSGEGAGSQGRVILPPLSLEAGGGDPDLELEGVSATLYPFGSTASGTTGVIGGSELALPELRLLSADRVYGEAGATLPALAMYADYGLGEPDYYGYVQELVIGSFFYTEPVVLASYAEDLELGTAEFSVLVAVDETSIEGLLLSDEIALRDYVERAISSGLDFSTTSATLPQELLQYAFNVANGAATRYDNYAFNQYVRSQGRTFAAAKDGLYEIRPGAGDNGQPISALVDFGAMAFGTSQKKIIETLFIGLNSDGELFAKVYADGGRERIYRAVQPGPTRRIRTARGISAREWQLKLEIVDATQVDLTDVDFIVAANARRWTR